MSTPGYYPLGRIPDVVNSSCATEIYTAYQNGDLEYQTDGEYIYAWTKDQKTEFIIDVPSGTLETRAGKRKYRCRLTEYEVKWALTFLAKRPVSNVVPISSTASVGKTFLVPMWCRRTPLILEFNADTYEWTLHQGYAALGETAYIVSPYASLACPPTSEADMVQIREAWKRGVEKWGAVRFTLAVLPYIAPHLKKRAVPLIIGKMRSGKTSMIDSIFSNWPQDLSIRTSLPSYAGLRDLLTTYNVVADDVNESINNRFDFVSIIVPYYDRQAVTRVGRELRRRDYFLRGTLIMASNNPAIELYSVADRMIAIDVEKFGRPPFPEIVIPESPWFIATPIVGLYVMERLEGLLAYLKTYDQFGDHVVDMPMEDLDPAVNFYRWLYRKLNKAKAEGCDVQRNRYLCGDDWCLRYDVRYIPHPSVGDTVVVTNGVSVNDSVTASVSKSLTFMRYTVGMVRLYLNRLNIPAKYWSHYFFIPCGQLDSVLETLRVFGLPAEKTKPQIFVSDTEGGGEEIEATEVLSEETPSAPSEAEAKAKTQ